MRTRSGLLTFALALVAAAGLSARAEAVPIVSIQPPSQDVLLGDTVSIDIEISDLTEPIGGFSLALSFDDAILAGTGYTIGAPLGTGLDLSGGFAGGVGSPLDLYFVSLEDEATLAAAQGTGFTLASVTFSGTANGLSGLRLGNVVVSDVLGFELDANSANGSVCVGGSCEVPEPTAMALLALGLALAARRRTSQSRR